VAPAQPRLIEIGGGTICTSGWVNLDPVHGEGNWRRRAQATPWPTGPNSVSEIYASHVMEHIPFGEPRVVVMNEAWRVLRPGGKLTIVVPLFPSEEAIGDPYHVSYWVERSFKYFTHEIVPNAEYNVKQWEQLEWRVEGGWEGHWVGKPCK